MEYVASRKRDTVVNPLFFIDEDSHVCVEQSGVFISTASSVTLGH